MGTLDQTIEKNAHAGSHDDGRTLRPVRQEDYLHTYDEFGLLVPGEDVLPSYSREAFLFRGKQLIPETLLQVHGEKFTPTKWESRYSTLSSTATEEQKFTPVIDDNYRVVGHLGWVGGYDIFVPKNTVGELSPLRVFFEEARLAEWHRQLVWSHDHPLVFPAQSAPAPPKRPAPCWPGSKAPISLGDMRRFEELTKAGLAGPGKDASEEQRLRENINFLVAGGGTAIVGEQWEARPHQPAPKLERYLLGQGMSSPGYSPITGVAQTLASFTNPSPFYRFLTLVGPDGLIQAVFRVEEFHPESRQDKILRIGLQVIDIAIMIWTVIDIVTIPIALAELAEGWLAKEALIQALRAHENAEVKAVLDEAARGAAGRGAAGAALRRTVGGAMSGPEQAEARTAWQKLREKFWKAGKRPPQKILTMTPEKVEEWNTYIAARMKELGVPENNIGVKIRSYDPKTGVLESERPLGYQNGKALDPAGDGRGGNYRSFRSDDEWEELGLSVHGNVFDDWQDFDLWNRSELKDRIDAVIVHELSEFNELTHWETVGLAPDTTLPIREGAREILRYMRIMGKPDMVFTEFTAAEWEAIMKAGMANGAFEEKLKIAATVAAKTK